jgi:hypothetical protein
MNLSPMDYIRAAIANALAEGLDLSEVWAAVDLSETPADFPSMVSAVADAKRAMGIAPQGKAWDEGIRAWV